MAAKRSREDTTHSPPDLTTKLSDDAVESSANFAKPLYLVAALWAEQPRPAYSVSMVDAAAAAGGNEPRRARTLAQLAGAEQGMSFVAAHSTHGSWIVGVGGLQGGAIIYDPSTQRTLQAPDISYPKHEPVLISHRGKVYAISRSPKVNRNLGSDFEPWFESLNFNKVVPCIYHNGCPSWKRLPSPPFFPCFLSPKDFRNPPEITVSSYAAFGSHILLSLEQQGTGTYAFHVGKKTWEKVCDQSLPFVGQAIPLGGSLFACHVKSNNVAAAATSVFHMSIKVFTPSSGKPTTNLSIQEFPVVSAEGFLWPLFCPLGKGSFCSIRWGGSSHQSRKAKYLKDSQISSKAKRSPQVILTTFQVVNTEDILAACQTESTKAKDLHVAVQVKQQNQTYKFRSKNRLVVSDMPVVAAMSISRDREHTDEGTTETWRGYR
uniref:Uncharacterized protein n=1 Tax=Arundo donax TaxID=35708 RepID=A0A0A8Z6V8_ARUDO